MRTRNIPLPPADGLTEREAEVLRMAPHLSNAQIAVRLDISPATVKLHIYSARQKHREAEEKKTGRAADA